MPRTYLHGGQGVCLGDGVQLYKEARGNACGSRGGAAGMAKWRSSPPCVGPALPRLGQLSTGRSTMAAHHGGTPRAPPFLPACVAACRRAPSPHQSCRRHRRKRRKTAPGWNSAWRSSPGWWGGGRARARLAPKRGRGPAWRGTAGGAAAGWPRAQLRLRQPVVAGVGTELVPPSAAVAAPCLLQSPSPPTAPSRRRARTAGRGSQIRPLRAGGRQGGPWLGWLVPGNVTDKVGHPAGGQCLKGSGGGHA